MKLMQRVHSLSAQIPVALPNPCWLRPETRVDWADADTCLLHFVGLDTPLECTYGRRLALGLPRVARGRPPLQSCLRLTAPNPRVGCGRR